MDSTRESTIDFAEFNRAIRTPGLGRFADHHWFVIGRGVAAERWEVWQRSDAGGDNGYSVTTTILGGWRLASDIGVGAAHGKTWRNHEFHASVGERST